MADDANPALGVPATSPPTSLGRRLVSFLRWVVESFGSLLVFYWVEHRFGLVDAIVAGVVVSVVIVAVQIVREKTPSRLTLVTAASVLVFGALDLTFRSAFFVKLEPVLGNLVWAGVFLGSVASGRSLILDLVERQRGALPPAARRYMTAVTVAWGVLFVLRAAAYLWMAFHLSIDQAMAARAVVGPVSFGAMFLGEMGFRFLRFGKRAFGK